MRALILFSLIFSINSYSTSDCVHCIEDDQSLSLFDLSSWVSNGEQILECSDLTNPGDVKLVNVSMGDRVRSSFFENTYQAPNANHYSLRYVGDKKYEMVFNVDFNLKPTATVSENQMRQRVESCLERVSPHLKGPNGESLTMRITSPEAANALRGQNSEGERINVKPPLISIDIIEGGVRGNATNFASDFKCHTILHEMLHHAGLCDEYNEQDPELLAHESRCRARGPLDSIMGDGMFKTVQAKIGRTLHCNISIPQVSTFLNDPEKSDVLKEIVMRKKHTSIGLLAKEDVGLPESAKDPKRQFCTTRDEFEIPIPTSKDQAFSKIESYSIDKIEISSLDYDILNQAVYRFKPYKRILSCDCSSVTEHKESCFRYIRELKKEATLICQPSARYFACPFGSMFNKDKHDELEPGEVEITSNLLSMAEVPFDDGSSLLYPAQFLRLINGPCERDSTPSMVKKYNACARFSRKFSQARCELKPSFCDDTAQWLGTSR